MKQKIFASVVILALIYGGAMLMSGNLGLKTVLSGSMSPAFNAGDVILISKTNPDSIKEGDIITFRTGKAFTTHRVIGLENGSFMTKGDANEDPDIAPVSKSAVAGKVIFAIPYMGYLGKFVRTPGGFILLIFIPGILIIYSEIRKIASEIKEQ